MIFCTWSILYFLLYGTTEKSLKRKKKRKKNEILKFLNSKKKVKKFLQWKINLWKKQGQRIKVLPIHFSEFLHFLPFFFWKTLFQLSFFRSKMKKWLGFGFENISGTILRMIIIQITIMSCWFQNKKKFYLNRTEPNEPKKKMFSRLWGHSTFLSLISLISLIS